jgi:hypothetical protein
MEPSIICVYPWIAKASYNTPEWYAFPTIFCIIVSSPIEYSSRPNSQALLKGFLSMGFSIPRHNYLV